MRNECLEYFHLEAPGCYSVDPTRHEGGDLNTCVLSGRRSILPWSRSIRDRLRSRWGTGGSETPV